MVPDLVHLRRGAKAPATLRKYRGGWLRWRAWALSKFSIPLILPQPLHLALFLTDLTNTAKENCLGFSSLEGAVYSIAYAHKLAGFHMSPTDHPFVKSTLKAARRSLPKPVRPKENFFLSLELVQGIASHYMSNSSLAVIRFLPVLLVGYAGFLRANEILRMSISDILLFPGHMLITLSKRKNDQYREGIRLILFGQTRSPAP